MFRPSDYSCSICKKKLSNPDLALYYPHAVCEECDKKAILKDGCLSSKWVSERLEKLRSEDPYGYKDKIMLGDAGPNPVYINGRKCWRRYRLASWVTMIDVHNSRTLEEFEQNNFS